MDDIFKISTPNSRMQLLILCRFLNQNASLYTDMQMHNSLYKNEVLGDIKDYFNHIDDLVQNTKNEDFEKEFNDIKDFIGEDKLKSALKITEKIDWMLKE